MWDGWDSRALLVNPSKSSAIPTYMLNAITQGEDPPSLIHGNSLKKFKGVEKEANFP